MKRTMLALALVGNTCLVGHAQMAVTDDVVAHSLEYELQRKSVLLSTPVTASSNEWNHSGLGFICDAVKDGRRSLLMQYPLFTGTRATGSADDPDYAIYGSCRATLKFNSNIEGYNRIRCSIFPDCDGVYVVNSNLVVNNQAAHLLNLRNRQWNECVLEFDTTMEGPVSSIAFYNDNKGPAINPSDTCRYYISDITLEKVSEPEVMMGWLPAKNEICYSTAGYDSEGHKSALMQHSPKNKSFSVVNDRGQTVFKGKPLIKYIGNESFDYMDFSMVETPGIYYIRCGKVQSKPFTIDNTLWENVEQKVLNYIFCQRCGYAVPGVHDKCHEDLFAHHNGNTISYGGGWHDAGDLSQQTLQTADVAFALLEAAGKMRAHNASLASKLMEEARWGLDFIMNSRFGDGYHASSMGLLIWQDGKTGTADDIHTVRVQNMAYDNFLYAAYEAFAAQQEGLDADFRQRLSEAAEEDFVFASEKFARDGYDHFVQPYEHTYSTSESLYHATISWAASMLYALTGKSAYAERAAHEMEYVLQCQQKDKTNSLDETAGFFWRNTNRTSIVHSIHQSREQLFALALTALCNTQPDHPRHAEWEACMKLHGEYLKSLMKYTSPYGMLPSGTYHEKECDDEVAFKALHLFPPTDAKERFTMQLKNGEHLAGGYYLKRFPVWFNIFNGNEAIHLSAGKTAALIGNYFHDDELLDIAREQLYWTLGKNPFRQSLIYGVGERYPQMDSFSSGEMIGEMPVGIRTYGDTDIPYWPQTNNACYKEVWVTTAGKCLSLVSSLSPSPSP